MQCNLNKVNLTESMVQSKKSQFLWPCQKGQRKDKVKTIDLMHNYIIQANCWSHWVMVATKQPPLISFGRMHAQTDVRLVGDNKYIAGRK